MELAKLFEGLMLIAFGASWPAQIIKTIRVKNPTGKSFVFQYLVIAGYVLGIISKLLGGVNWLIWVYLLDFALVFTDVILSHYYLYKLRRKQAAK